MPKEAASPTASAAALIGHETVAQRLLADWNNNRLPHAYLFAGRRGIGKATLALKLAQFILSQSEKKVEAGGLFGDALPAAAPASLQIGGSAVTLRMNAGTHTGFLHIRPIYDEKKDRYKDEINVDQIRGITSLLALTAGEGEYKIVIIEPAELMNPNAANALLKWIEEPPANTLFILVSHNPSRLLPTIRSRCRMVNFPPLSQAQCSAILAGLGIDLAGRDMALLTQFAGGSAGILAELAESRADEVFHELLSVLSTSGANSLAAYKFAESIAVSRRLSWENWGLVVNEAIGYYIKTLAGIPVPDSPAVVALASRRSLDAWLRTRDQLQQLHRDTEILYLERKHVVMLMLEALSGGDLPLAA